MSSHPTPSDPAAAVPGGLLTSPSHRPAATWIVGTPPSSLVTAWILGRVSAARRPLAEQMLRYGVVGGVCTAVFSGLYLVLVGPLGDALANTAAMVISAVLNTGLNRRHTFHAHGGAVRHHAQGMVILALNWILSTGSLAGLRVLIPAAAHVTELMVLTGANLGGTAMRFLLLRSWVFRSRGEPVARR